MAERKSGLKGLAIDGALHVKVTDAAKKFGVKLIDVTNALISKHLGDLSAKDFPKPEPKAEKKAKAPKASKPKSDKKPASKKPKSGQLAGQAMQAAANEMTKKPASAPKQGMAAAIAEGLNTGN